MNISSSKKHATGSNVDAGLGGTSRTRRSSAPTRVKNSIYPKRLPGLGDHLLRDVVNDTKSRAFCGPTAVATIVGQPISIVRDAFRLARYGAGWIDRARAPAIAGTSGSNVAAVLKMFGFVGYWETVKGDPTLAAFLEGRQGTIRTHPCIVEVTGHWVAVSGWQFCDTFSKGIVVDADHAPGRRKRVKRAFVIVDRVAPADIPRKDYSRAAAESARQRKLRATFIHTIGQLGGTYEFDEQWLSVKLADGDGYSGLFPGWDHATDDLRDFLEDKQLLKS